MADNDASQLSESQRQALEQFTAVTAQETKDAIPLLRRSQWNVEIAIAKFFDGETADPVAEAIAEQAAAAARPQIPPPSSLPTPGLPLRAGQRNRGTISPAPRIVPQPTTVSRRPPLLISLLLFPFSLVWRLSNSFVSLFYTLFPFLARFRTATSPPSRAQTARRSQNPRDTAARFIRLFEEEYGTETGLKFFEGGYAQALDLAKNELRFLLVVLQSDEHDDTASFNRETLISPEVVEFIKTQNIIVWAGSVQDSEAYQVSTALNCTKFPFAALISRAPSSSTGSSQGMSVVSRIVGPTPPQTLVSKLTTAITTHSETLERIRATRAVHEAGRAIREQQNSAYELSLARDREIARARREEAERKTREEELARARAEEKALLANNRTAWRQWRATTIPKEEPTGKDTVRVSIRLRNGERVIRRFNGDASMEEVYAFVECLEYLDESATNEKTPEKPGGYTHEYGFKLVSPMPREVYELQGERGGSERAVKDCFWPTASLVVEVDDNEDEEGEDN